MKKYFAVRAALDRIRLDAKHLLSKMSKPLQKVRCLDVKPAGTQAQ
ncbi:hypothetical protein [Roseivivax lentus]|nr:hypothetical protein [Roseivivax lentus]